MFAEEDVDEAKNDRKKKKTSENCREKDDIYVRSSFRSSCVERFLLLSVSLLCFFSYV